MHWNLNASYKKMNELVTKMSKTSKVISVLFRIAEIASYVGIGMTALSAVLLAVIGETSIAHTLGKITLKAGISGLGIESLSVGMAIAAYVALFIYLIVFAVLCRKVSRMFKTIQREKTPFRMEFVKELRIISVAFLVISIFPDDGIGSFEPNITMIGVLGALLIWCLSYIMHYGCILQQESDETL